MSIILPSVKTGISLLRKHLRVAGGSPSRWMWVAWRGLQIVRRGGLGATLSRHSAAQDLYADYPAWAAKHLALTDDDRAQVQRQLAAAGPLPLLSIVMPTRNTPIEWLDAAIRSVRAQLYPRWELCIADDGSDAQPLLARLAALAGDGPIRVHQLKSHAGIGVASNAAIAMATGEFVILLDHDDALAPEALYMVWQASLAYPDADIFYSDEDKLAATGALADPHLKPAWDAELFLTMNYMGHLVAIRRRLLADVGGFAPGLDGAQDWDLLLRCTERLPDGGVRHIPRVLYHWRVHRGSTAAGLVAKPSAERAQRTAITRALERRGIHADVQRTQCGWRVHRRPVIGRRVSIVIPTRGRGDLLEPLLAALARERRRFDLDVIVIDQAGDAGEVRAVVERQRGSLAVNLLALDGPFNFARLCNHGVAHARGEFVVLLNDDVLPDNDEWLTELVTQAARPEVGLVGGLLHYPDGRVQHAGILLGINGTAEHIWRGYPHGWGGIHGRAQQVQQVTAVTGACIALRTDVWAQVGGMDDRLARAFNDVDLCLRVRAAGLMVLFTPFAEAMHYESATRGLDDTPELQRQHRDEENTLRTRWNNLDEVDRAYHPSLARARTAFALSDTPALATPWRSDAGPSAR